MYQIDRIAVIIKPTQVFVDWVNQHTQADDEKITYAAVREDCTTFLIPPFEDMIDAEEFISSIYQEVFDCELEAWYLDASIWPINRTYKVFKEWFDIEYHNSLFDLALVDDEEPMLAEGTLQ